MVFDYSSNKCLYRFLSLSLKQVEVHGVFKIRVYRKVRNRKVTGQVRLGLYIPEI